MASDGAWRGGHLIADSHQRPDWKFHYFLIEGQTIRIPAAAELLKPGSNGQGRTEHSEKHDEDDITAGSSAALARRAVFRAQFR